MTETPVPMSRKDHLRRGYCCQNGCLHCPWDFSGKGNPLPTAEEQKQYNLLEKGSVFSQ